MLLRNSTSMTWISLTSNCETSAQVLLVYVLSSKTTTVSTCFPRTTKLDHLHLLPSMRAITNSLHSLPPFPLTCGEDILRR